MRKINCKTLFLQFTLLAGSVLVASVVVRSQTVAKNVTELGKIEAEIQSRAQRLGVEEKTLAELLVKYTPSYTAVQEARERVSVAKAAIAILYVRRHEAVLNAVLKSKSTDQGDLLRIIVMQNERISRTVKRLSERSLVNAI